MEEPWTILELAELAADAAWPAASTTARAGTLGTRGYPKLAHSSRRCHDTAIQRRLWTVSEELTGVTFPV